MAGGYSTANRPDRGRKEIATMRSSWSPSADGTGDDVALLRRRRFVEAARRAEIIALVNRASAEASADALTRELCEAFDAEFAFCSP